MSTQLTVGASKNSISRARSSIERILAFSLWFSLLAHGLFFSREVLAMGVILALYEIWRGRLIWGKSSIVLAETDLLLFGMAALSFSGLLFPVKAEEAWLEGIRYLIYWFIYSRSREISADRRSRRKLFQNSVWAALALALSGWLPWVSKIWPSPVLPEAGRLSSWLGYPNATAAFLGAVFFLPGLNLWLRLFIFLSIVSTGSRSALVLLLLLKGIELLVSYSESINFRVQKKTRVSAFTSIVSTLRRLSNSLVFRLRGKELSKSLGVSVIFVLLGLVFLAGIGLMSRFHPAVNHLLVWGSSKSLGERLLYFQDGFRLAWAGKFLPRAGGWLAFPLVQTIPYWTLDPHSSLLHVLLNQGLPGVIGVGAWIFLWLKRVRKADSIKKVGPQDGNEGWTGIFFAAIFLLLHSVVDADLSFAALGIFFWLLVGQLDEGLCPESGMSINLQIPFARKVSGSKVWFNLIFSIFLLVAISKVLFLLNIPLGGKSVSAQSAINIPELAQALATDQSNLEWRRKLAELEFQKGDWEQGLKELQKVLAWEKFDVRTYEWAQSIVWEAAETQRLKGNPVFRRLYQWVAQVPDLIERQAESVPLSERYLWPGYTSFHSTPHIELLAKQAREFTFYSP